MTTALCARSAYSDRSWVRWLESSKRLKLRFYWRMGESFMIQIGRYQIFFFHVKCNDFWNFYQFRVWEISPFASKTVTWAFLSSPPTHSAKLWLCWTCTQSGSLDFFKCIYNSVKNFKVLTKLGSPSLTKPTLQRWPTAQYQRRTVSDALLSTLR